MSSSLAALGREIIAAVRDLPSRRTADIRALRRTFSRRLAKADPGAVIEIALRVLAEPGIEFRFVAYELICCHRAAQRQLREKHLKLFGRGLDSWGAVDTFACYLAGPAWRERQVQDALVHRWARSKNRWWRRAALVATVPLNNKTRGGSGDPVRTFQLCNLLVHDRDDMVVKALSWALRELAKGDPMSVRAFLEEHEGALAARVVREVRNKLTTGLKNPRDR